MKYEYAYEVIGIAFLVLILARSDRKSWLDLKVNRYFSHLLRAGVCLTLLDMLVHLYVQYINKNVFIGQYALVVVHGCAMVIFAWLFFKYFVTLSGYGIFSVRWQSVLLTVPMLAACLMLLVSPATHLGFYIDEAGLYHKGTAYGFITAVMLAYLIGMCIFSFFGPAAIPRAYGLLAVLQNLLFCAAVGMQLMHGRFLLSFYAADYIILVYYLLFQNQDRYADRLSGGFSRAGFQKVIREKFAYRERFSCLFITIKNYQNIIGLCEDDEFEPVQAEIGNILRRYGGRKNQFHIHGSDYAILQKKEEESVALYEHILNSLPQTVRISSRNVPINYGYYMLTLEEAAYDQEEFYKMQASMKKMLNDQLDNTKLMRYEGDVQRSIDLELHIARMLKEILRKKRCDICFYPIMDAETGKRHALEGKIYMLRENGSQIAEGAIWAVARDLGYLRELGRITLESIFELVSREHVLERGINKVAINVSPMHISSESVIRDFRFLAKKYGFPMNRFCVELTEDVSVPLEQMEQYIVSLREDGVSLILDHYGDSVCNLQGIMKMPFDFVKISKRIVSGYCAGENDILEYQIRMLRDNGWKICLGGIDDLESYEKVKDLDEVTFLQGGYYSRPVTPERFRLYMEEG